MIPPGKTLGILGGGQLGRMIALAARPLGYRVHVLDPDPHCAARPVVERCITAPFDDAEAARQLDADVVTLEIEKIPRRTLEAITVPLRPGAAVLDVVRDRFVQKTWLGEHGFPLPRYKHATSAAELALGVQALGAGCFVKSCTGGYDGRGQLRLSPTDDATQAYADLGGRCCVIEEPVALEAEISVLVARRPNGEVAVYPPAYNHHEKQILVWSVIPATLSDALTRRAQELAARIAAAIGLEGLLAVEMFLTKNGELLVNELAPRPHNSYHASEVATVTSQFEQAVRAACDLPLGSVEVVRPAAIKNLLGDLWQQRSPNFAAALTLSGVRLTLYGKGDPRPGRKMGHLTASAATAEGAVKLVQRAYEQL